MLHALATVVLAVDEHEPSKVPFYVCGGLFAAWAVALGFFGLRSESFPGGEGSARGVMAVSAVLMVAALATSVITA